MKKKTALLIVSIIFIISVGLWTLWGNTALELNSYTAENELIPDSFDGFRIVQISDLHNAQFGTDNEKLLNLLKEAKPDIIAITGDMVDSRRTEVDVAIDFAREAVKIAPCYYVTGNHEQRISSEYENLKEGLESLNVNVLDNEKTYIELDGQIISLTGINDPSFAADTLFESEAEVVSSLLNSFSAEENTFSVLLSHRPELFDVYAENGFNLILSGHAHGGQFRIPFLGGLIAPHQGLFPEYDGGLYEKDKTAMIVSRGIGNSIIPIRFNNRPEVILIELKRG